MTKSNRSESGLVRAAAWLLPLAALLALAVGLFFAFRSAALVAPLSPRRPELTALDTGWVLSAGAETLADPAPGRFETAAESVTLRRRVTADEAARGYLLFANDRQSVTIEADGREIFQINTTPLTRYLQVSYACLAVLPETDDSFELTVTLSRYPDGACSVPEFRLGTRYAVLASLCRSEIVTLANLTALLLFGVVLLIAMIIFAVKGIRDRRVPCLVLFLFCVVLWAFADSNLPILLGVGMETVGLVCYLAFMLLPLPIIYFVNSSCDKACPSLRLLPLLSSGNILLQLALTLFGFTRLQDTLFLTHLLIVLMIVVSLARVGAIRRERRTGEFNFLYLSLLVLAGFIALSLLLYWTADPGYYRATMLCGVSIFYLMLLILMLFSVEDRIRQGKMNEARLEIYQKLSLLDGLTGLSNRRAFDARMAEIDALPEPRQDMLLVIFDMNGLKYTNDNYGHAAGDDLICMAARLIRGVYGTDGECYRIGGDEFAAVLRAPQRSELYYAQQLEASIRRHNEENTGTDYALSIAHGESHLLRSNGLCLGVSDWKQEADVRMYANKKAAVERPAYDEPQELRNIIECIIATIDAKDSYTANHSLRVRVLSELIANRMGLSPITVSEIRVSAQMHDIGKVGIPDSILTKPGRLTPEEYTLMKRHSVIGAQIVSRADDMTGVAATILHHHERYDGKGYPDALAGDAIPLGSRIIAVADSIDAMTSFRCYRPAMSLADCRREVESNSEIMYDPAVVRIALDNWSEIERIVLTHPNKL